jgi:hypothetical protein
LSDWKSLLPYVHFFAEYLPAHDDGSRVLFDESVVLRPNTRLIVTVLEHADPDREAFLSLSSSALGAAYSDDEVEYTEADLESLGSSDKFL